MDENTELLKDYIECLDRTKNFEAYNYTETEEWAVIKYAKWVNKDSRYALPLSVSPYIPNDNKTKAWNAINNLKDMLYNIAIIKNIKI